MNPSDSSLLLAFDNGVFDFSTRTFRDFRAGIQIPVGTLSVGYDYDPVPNPEIDTRLLQVLEQIFPHPDTFAYAMRFLGSCLVSVRKDPESRLHIGYGRGSSGKSIIQLLMLHVLGALGRGVNSMLLSRDPNDPNSIFERYELIGKRFVAVSEMQKWYRINASALRQLTSGEPFVARQMYSPLVTTTPKFKMLLMTTDLPDLSHVSTRTVVIPFVSRFMDSDALRRREQLRELGANDDGQPMENNDEFYYQDDPTLVQWIKTREVIQAMARLLVHECIQFLECPTTVCEPPLLFSHDIYTDNHIVIDR